MTGISHYYSTPSVICGLWDAHSGFSRPKISQYIRKTYFIMVIPFQRSQMCQKIQGLFILQFSLLACPMADVASVYNHALEQC